MCACAGWQKVGPVAGSPKEPWQCRKTGLPCAGACQPSWHPDCSPLPSQFSCDDCQPGSYRCIGEKQNSMMACDITRCDPAQPSYNAQECQCSKLDGLGSAQTVGGLCGWVDAPSVVRDMSGPEIDKKCQDFNMGDTRVEPVAECESAACGRTQFTCQGVDVNGNVAVGKAVCSTDSSAVCQKTCLLDASCVAVTWDPPVVGGNSSRAGRCYKVNTVCKPSDSATGEQIFHKVSLLSFLRSLSCLS